MHILHITGLFRIWTGFVQNMTGQLQSIKKKIMRTGNFYEVQTQATFLLQGLLEQGQEIIAKLFHSNYISSRYQGQFDIFKTFDLSLYCCHLIQMFSGRRKMEGRCQMESGMCQMFLRRCLMVLGRYKIVLGRRQMFLGRCQTDM